LCCGCISVTLSKHFGHLWGIEGHKKDCILALRAGQALKIYSLHPSLEYLLPIPVPGLTLRGKINLIEAGFGFSSNLSHPL